MHWRGGTGYYEFDTHNNLCFSPVIAIVIGPRDLASHNAAETTGLAATVPGPVRILNVLIGLFFLRRSCHAWE